MNLAGQPSCWLFLLLAVSQNCQGQPPKNRLSQHATPNCFVAALAVTRYTLHTVCSPLVCTPGRIYMYSVWKRQLTRSGRHREPRSSKVPSRCAMTSRVHIFWFGLDAVQNCLTCYMGTNASANGCLSMQQRAQHSMAVGEAVGRARACCLPCAAVINTPYYLCMLLHLHTLLSQLLI